MFFDRLIHRTAFDILYFTKYLNCLGILGMDYKCIDTFISALLAVTNASKRRCGMGEW